MSSNRKILVTGAKGQLGRDLVRVLERDFKTVGADKEQFDIRDLKATRDFITAENPDVIVHSAAYTDVDGCEENREKAIKINGLGTRNVAIAARKTDARLFYISTDYVFSGDKSQPYVDFDPPNPQTVYGQSKLLGEKFVLEQLSEFCILRIAWLYGIHGGNFVKTMINKCEKGEDLQVVEDQAGSPTWAKDVARQVSTLIPT